MFITHLCGCKQESNDTEIMSLTRVTQVCNRFYPLNIYSSDQVAWYVIVEQILFAGNNSTTSKGKDV